MNFSTLATNEVPDGKIVTDPTMRQKLWGPSWHSYYMLNTTYYMSALSTTVLGILKNNFFWVDALSNSPALAATQRQSAADRINKIATDMAGLDKGHGLGSSSARTEGGESEKPQLAKVAQGACNSAVEGCQHCSQQMMKLLLFASPLAIPRRGAKAGEMKIESVGAPSTSDA
jgi:hypothetical protein